MTNLNIAENVALKKAARELHLADAYARISPEVIMDSEAYQRIRALMDSTQDLAIDRFCRFADMIVLEAREFARRLDAEREVLVAIDMTIARNRKRSLP